MEKTRTTMNIKSKLTAAVAMLLVAFFMVISSSYAWFTLSTAPEVTGITTNIGANGNLEIALLYYDGDDKQLSAVAESIITGTSSGSNVFESNKTWGNLVDLNYDGYGLKNISLLPSRLNVDTATNMLKGSVLKTPAYGADGRIASLEEKATTAIFGTSSFDKEGFGVRGLGVSSSMTPQEADFRNAKAAIKSSVSAANKAAVDALNKYGTALATILMNHANGVDTTSDVKGIGDMIAKLQGTNGEKGVVDNLDSALFAFATMSVAKNLEGNPLYQAVTINKVESTADTLTITYSPSLTEGQTEDTLTLTGSDLPESIKGFMTLKTDISETLAAAETAYNTATENGAKTTGLDWSAISSILQAKGATNQKSFIDPNGVTVGGYNVDELKANMQNVLTQYLADMHIKVEFTTGTFVDIANATNTGITSGVKMNVTVESAGVSNMPVDARIIINKTDAAVDVVAVANGIAAPVSDGDQVKTLTELYGYVLDLAFRTNASGSNLLLQTTPENRIYAGHTNPDEETDVQGGGATMTFKTETPVAFTTADVLKLMKAIRIVFVDDTNTILAVGAADQASKVPVYEEDGVTVKEEGQGAVVDGDTVKAPIYLYDYVIGDGTKTMNGEIVPNEVLMLGEKKTDTNGNYNAAITSLTKNTAKVVSAYVYLDGDIVDNSMVANAEKSMTGMINLQFASDATLTPMEYAPLKGESTNTDTSTEATTEATTTPAVDPGA